MRIEPTVRRTDVEMANFDAAMVRASKAPIDVMVNGIVEMDRMNPWNFVRMSVYSNRMQVNVTGHCAHQFDLMSLVIFQDPVA